MRSSGLHLSGGCYLPSDQLGLLRERPLASLRAHRYSFPGRCSQGTRDLTRIEGAHPFEFSFILYKVTEISCCFKFFICGTNVFSKRLKAISKHIFCPSLPPRRLYLQKILKTNFKSKSLLKSPPRRLGLQKLLKTISNPDFCRSLPPEDLTFKKF